MNQNVIPISELSRLVELAKSAGISMNDICRQCKWQSNRLWRLINGYKQPTMEEVEAIRAYLHTVGQHLTEETEY